MTFPLLRITSTLLLIAGAIAADAPSPVITAAVPASETQSVVRADLARMRREALVTAPTSLFADPQAAAALSHLHSQLAAGQAAEVEMPPLLELFLQAPGVLLALGSRTGLPANANEEARLAVALLLDAGQAHTPMRSWCDHVRGKLRDIHPDRHGAFEGFVSDEVFLGWSEKQLAIASILVPNTWPSPATVPLPATAISAEADLAPFLRSLASMAALQVYGDAGQLVRLFPELTTMQPRVRTTIDVADHWHGHIDVHGVGAWPLLGSIDPLLPARLGEPDASLSLAVDPQQLANRIVASLVPHGDDTAGEALMKINEELQQTLGVSVAQLSAAFSGTISVGAYWRDQPIPTIVGLVGVRDVDVLASVVALAAQQVNADVLLVDGAHSAWTFQVGLPMTITVVLGKDVLAISQDAERAIQALKPQPASPTIAPGEAAVLTIERRLMATGLQVAWNHIITIDEPLTRDTRSRLYDLTYSCQYVISQLPADTAWPMTFAVLADDAAENLHYLTDAVASATHSETTGLAFLDANCTLLVGPPTENDNDLLITVLWREADGLHANPETWGAPPRIVDDQALAALLETHPRRVGADPATLPALTFPNIPRIDARCFPPLPVVLRHLPEHYQCSVTATPDTITLDETGLPLLSGLLGTCSVVAPLASMDLDRRRAYREESQRDEAMQQKYAAQYTAFEAVGRALTRAHEQDKAFPKLASGLIGDEFGLTHDDLAGLGDWSDPSELDAMGTWRSHIPEGDHTDWIWRLPVEPGISLIVTSWGEVSFMDDARIK